MAACVQGAMTDPGDSRRASLKRAAPAASKHKATSDPGDSRRASLKLELVDNQSVLRWHPDPGDSRRASLKLLPVPLAMRVASH